jgi:microcystin-dependent protein
MASISLTNTNISETYVGVLHAKGAPIPESGLQDVYDGFGNKSALKIGQTSVDIDGTIGDDFKNAIAAAIYPVGSVLFSTDNNNPGSRFTGTTWEQVAEGRFIASVGTGNDGTESVAIAAGNDSTGKYNTTLTIEQIPAHSHLMFKNEGALLEYRFNLQAYATRTTGYYGSYNYQIESTPTGPPDTYSTADAGSGDPHTNLPPSFGMYMWKRTS